MFFRKSKLIKSTGVAHSGCSAHQCGAFDGGVRVSPPGHSNPQYRREMPPPPPVPGKAFSHAHGLCKNALRCSGEPAQRGWDLEGGESVLAATVSLVSCRGTSELTSH